MNSITIISVLIVVAIAALLGAALIWIVRSLLQTQEGGDSGSMSLKEREKHIDTLLKEFEEQMDQTGDQDDRDTKA